ncbi:UNVERIFIED_CONTAM: hypothetical protein K2H54_077122 [Gekko kuhli]
MLSLLPAPRSQESIQATASFILLSPTLIKKGFEPGMQYNPVPFRDSENCSIGEAAALTDWSRCGAEEARITHLLFSVNKKSISERVSFDSKKKKKKTLSPGPPNVSTAGTETITYTQECRCLTARPRYSNAEEKVEAAASSTEKKNGLREGQTKKHAGWILRAACEKGRGGTVGRAPVWSGRGFSRQKPR